MSETPKTHPAIEDSPIGPIAEPRDFQRQFHGYSDSDPWRWIDVPLEGQATPERTDDVPVEGEAATERADDVAAVNVLVEAENRWAEKLLAPTQKLQDTIVEEIRQHTQLTDVTAPVRRGEYWYYSRIQEGSDYYTHHRLRSETLPQLDAHTRPEGEETILDEVRRARGQEFYNMENYAISPSGNLAAFSEDVTGAETFDLKIRDLQSGEIIDEGVRAVAYGIALTDEYVWYARNDDAWRQCEIWVHRIGADPATDRLVLREPDALFNVMVELSRDGKWVVISSGSALTSKCWIAPADGVSAPRLVAAPEHGVRYLVEVAGDHLAIVHNRLREDESLAVAQLPAAQTWQSPDIGEDGAVVPGVAAVGDVPETGGGDDVPQVGQAPAAPDLAAPALDELAPAETWVDVLVPAEGERLLKCDAFRDFVALTMRSDGQTALRILRRHEPASEAPVTHEELGAIYSHSSDVQWPLAVRVIEPGLNPQWDTDRVRFIVESFALPPVWADWLVETDTAQVVKATEVDGFNPDEYEVRREWVEASDGTKIPVSMVMRKGTTPDGTHPGWLYGYGSYEASTDPWFSRPRLSLLQRGVVYAMAHIRGGGEMGRAWYENGKFAAKPNTFTDFVAVAEWMQDSGWVQPGRLAAEGGSAGGLLMGAVANLAPEAFRVIVAKVPFVDALNTILDPTKPLTVGEWEEWGNPIESREIFEVMRSYSPYDNVREDVAYPAILALTSLNDIRVSFVEPLKWMQRLRARTRVGADNPVLCRLELVAGHAGGSGRTRAWEDYARTAAFVLTKLECES